MLVFLIRHFVFLAPKSFFLIWLSSRFILSLTQEDYSRNPPHGLTLISTVFFYYNTDQFIIDVGNTFDVYVLLC
jgi:hypothetical protein